MIKPYFQGFKDVILSEIRSATQSIKIAVAWFTDADVFNLLIKKRQEGISVMLVLSDDHLNFNQAYSLDFERFRSSGCILVVQERSFMHHKFCIIDETVLLMGSVNYTKNGFFKNKESFFKITEEPSTIQDFLSEFDSLTGGVIIESGIIVSPEKQRLIIEVTLLTNQLTWLEIAVSDAEKLILDYEIIYRNRFINIIERTLFLKRELARRQALMTQKIEEREAEVQAEENWQQFKDASENVAEQAVKLTDVELQKELKQLYRDGVKLCHPDNPQVADKVRANAIFDALKKSYESNNLDRVTEIVADLKAGIAFSTDFKEVSLENLAQLIDRINKKCGSLTEKLESITKDKRYKIMLGEKSDAEDHFQREEKLLKLIEEQLRNQVTV
jgi:HKD family nuclease